MIVPPSPHSAAKPSPSLSGVLLLDATGRIELANQTAANLWQTTAGELVGELLPNLFSFDVRSREPDWLQAQWEVLLAAAGDQGLRVNLQPKAASERFAGLGSDGRPTNQDVALN